MQMLAKLNACSDVIATMADRATNNAASVENFQLEVNEDARDIQRRVEALRDKIAEHRGSHENFSGFLLGPVDSYLDVFDA